MVSLNDLPEELIAMILDAVGDTQSICNLRSTCRKWARIRDPPECLAHAICQHPKARTEPQGVRRIDVPSTHQYELGDHVFVTDRGCFLVPDASCLPYEDYVYTPVYIPATGLYSLDRVD